MDAADDIGLTWNAVGEQPRMSGDRRRLRNGSPKDSEQTAEFENQANKKIV